MLKKKFGILSKETGDFRVDIFFKQRHQLLPKITPKVLLPLYGFVQNNYNSAIISDVLVADFDQDLHFWEKSIAKTKSEAKRYIAQIIVQLEAAFPYYSNTAYPPITYDAFKYCPSKGNIIISSSQPI